MVVSPQALLHSTFRAIDVTDTRRISVHYLNIFYSIAKTTYVCFFQMSQPTGQHGITPGQPASIGKALQRMCVAH